MNKKQKIAKRKQKKSRLRLKAKQAELLKNKKAVEVTPVKAAPKKKAAAKKKAASIILSNLNKTHLIPIFTCCCFYSLK